MALYGLPYMGSKSGIADQIIPIFPKADHFYDLFGGGFSITHAMLERRSKHFKHFHFNEIRPGITQLIQDAIARKYSYENFKPPFVEREEFFAKLDSDPYIKICWSFGNNGKGYIFSKEITPYKRSLHNAIVFNEFDSLAEKTLGMSQFKEGYSIYQRRLFLRNKIEYYRLKGIPKFLQTFLPQKQLDQLEPLQQLQRLEQLQQLEQLQRLERLEQLEQLERLERLEQLEKLNYYSSSFEKIKIKPNSIIYCDPPYLGTGEYDGNKQFDHQIFLDWAAAHKTPIFISEYNINDKRFTLIKSIDKISRMSSNSRVIKKEKIYVNQAALKLLKERTNNG